MNSREAVLIAMKIFTNCYPGRFIVEEGMVDTWVMVLGDLDPNVIKVAALHLASIKKDWPPDMATLREQCLLMSQGKLQEKTGSEAWGQILKKMDERCNFGVWENVVNLTAEEQEALDQTTSIYNLKNGIGETSSFARGTFIKAYDAIVEKRRLERLTLPEVGRFIEKKKPKMIEEPKKEPKKEPAVLVSDTRDHEAMEKMVDKLAGRFGI